MERGSYSRVPTGPSPYLKVSRAVRSDDQLQPDTLGANGCINTMPLSVQGKGVQRQQASGSSGSATTAKALHASTLSH